MNIRRLLFAVILTGVGFALAWVVSWDFIVPKLFSRWTWEGYDVLTVPVFFVGAVVRLLAVAMTGNNSSSRRRHR